MKREPTGHAVVVSVFGEPVEAFVPVPLPPSPPLAIDGPLQRVLERAILALGRLEAAAAALPDTGPLLYSYIRKEAVLSSRIEGTQSSLSDLLLHEIDEAPGVPLADVEEVSRYVAALDHGIARMRAGFPLSSRLIREVHEVLLSHGRGRDKLPGEFRRSQNWIGGTRPGNARFVPPPPTEVAGCITELERFLHTDDDLPALVRAGLAHVQFETIHPFLDGNGRTGRLLIALMLEEAEVLRSPLLYLSLYFKQHRERYYELLDATRREGEWEAWLSFFLEGVESTAIDAANAAKRLEERYAEDRQRIEGLGRRAKSAIRVHDALKRNPILSVPATCRATQLSFPAAASALEALTSLGVVVEYTGKRRGRIYAYTAILRILNEGTE